MNGKVCIVTGGNTGIGKETARGLAQRGAKVVLACRDTARGEAARDDIARSTGRKDVEVIALDLGSKASIRAFGERFSAAHERLDVLVNNAGVWRSSRGTTEEGLEATFGVNHVGTWLLTQDLLPLLKKSAPSRVVVLSSKLHYRGRMDWEDLQFERRKYGTTAAYAQSKLANVLFTKALARRLEGTGVTVNAVHPGVVRTELMRDYPKLLVKIFTLFLLTPEQGAECSLHVATAPELAGVTGEYFEKSRIKPAAAEALDEAAQERLWALTEALAA
ncbi:SDR family oxidoreductase [Sorangium sp. So ce381]|uniref:SDR family oxidoreductase n=1 Tax=Sorangium sp. So ce381 TaxID=3133307 RepID=UPI003F5B2B68